MANPKSLDWLLGGQGRCRHSGLLPTRPGKPGLELLLFIHRAFSFISGRTLRVHILPCPWSLTKVLNKQINEPRTARDKHEHSGFGLSTASDPVATPHQGGFLTLSRLIVHIPCPWIRPVVTFLGNHETESHVTFAITHRGCAEK